MATNAIAVLLWEFVNPLSILLIHPGLNCSIGSYVGAVCTAFVVLLPFFSLCFASIRRNGAFQLMLLF